MSTAVEEKVRPLTGKAAMKLVFDLAAAIEKWNESEVNVEYEGQIYKDISEALDTAIRRCCDSVLDTEVDPAAYRAVMALDNVSIAFQRYLMAASMQQARPGGNHNLIKSLNAIVELAKPRPALANPRPVEWYYKQGVSERQIAMTFGWYDDAGEPDGWKVQEELEMPGTHFNPKTWVHPALRAEQKAATEMWAVHARNRRRLSEPEEQRAPIKDIEYYIQQGAPVKQILNLFPELSEEDVTELMAAMPNRPASGPAAAGNHIAATERFLANADRMKLDELNGDLIK